MKALAKRVLASLMCATRGTKYVIHKIDIFPDSEYFLASAVALAIGVWQYIAISKWQVPRQELSIDVNEIIKQHLFRSILVCTFIAVPTAFFVHRAWLSGKKYVWYYPAIVFVGVATFFTLLATLGFRPN